MRTAGSRRGAALACAALLLGAACSLEESQAPDSGDARLSALPRELTAAERRVIEASNDFAFALFARAASDADGPNLVLSPLSASMALGMLLNGAIGETRIEMERALRLEELDPHAINASYAALLDLLAGLDDDVRFSAANAVFARRGVALEQIFLDTVASYFDANVRVLDFDDPSSVDVINRWVREHTNDRIEKMVEQIDPMAVLFLMNAIDFKGDWTRPFDPARTRTAPFTRADGSSVEVPMMDMDEARHSFARLDDGTTLVDLSYSRGAWSMTLVLPPGDVQALEYAATLDRTRWDALVAALDSTDRVMVALPRFTLEHERVLNDDLRALGMGRAFTDAAELDALSADADLYVHEVKQKSFIAVDEVGTEAAAVTSVEVRVVSMGPSIVLDRPFLFAIRERLSGAVLFVGVVGDP